MKDNLPIKLRSLTVEQLLVTVADITPVAGGGAVAALVAALGGALATMVASLESRTVARTEAVGLREQAMALQNQLAALAQSDVQAFSELIRARRLSLTGENAAAQRARAIQDALRNATEVPLTTVAACVDLLGLIAQMAIFSRPAALSDLAVAVWTAYAGLRGAAGIVRANLCHLQDSDYRIAVQLRLDQLLTSGEAALADALRTLDQRE